MSHKTSFVTHFISRMEEKLMRELPDNADQCTYLVFTQNIIHEDLTHIIGGMLNVKVSREDDNAITNRENDRRSTGYIQGKV